MYSRDYRDMIGGAVLFAGGAFVAGYAATQYQLGSLARMGPGLFPAALGVLLCLFGIALTIQALLRPGTLPSVKLRPLIFVLASILVFGLTVRRFGIVPAVVLLTLVASLADTRLSWPKAMLLAAGLATLAVLIFNVALDIPIAAVIWWGK